MDKNMDVPAAPINLALVFHLAMASRKKTDPAVGPRKTPKYFPLVSNFAASQPGMCMRTHSRIFGINSEPDLPNTTKENFRDFRCTKLGLGFPARGVGPQGGLAGYIFGACRET